MADQERPGVIKGIRMNYRMTKEVDRRLPLILLGSFVFAGAVGFALFYLLGRQRSSSARSRRRAVRPDRRCSSSSARRSQRAMYVQLEGQVGAAGRALQMLRRGWKIEAPVAFNKQQDLVHRVVGPPGIVLVGEGNPNRVRPLLTAERRKHERVVADTPVHEIVVGYGEGEVPLRKLVRHVQKLPKTTKPARDDRHPAAGSGRSTPRAATCRSRRVRSPPA